MIYKHKHLSEEFLSNKKLLKVSQQLPFVLVISQQFSFLNSFLINCLKIKNIRHQIRVTKQLQIMEHQLPVLAFGDYLLSQQSLIQFISDLMLQSQSFTNLQQRKQIAKQLYKKWFTIIKQQHTGLSKFSNLRLLGVHTQQDYHNHLFTNFLILISWIKSDIPLCKYEGYKRNEINLQTLLVFDIISSLLTMCKRTTIDHILRAHFQSLIQFQEQFKTKISSYFQNNRPLQEITQRQVVVDKTNEIPKQAYPQFKSNSKKFCIVLALVAGIYFKWAD